MNTDVRCSSELDLEIYHGEQGDTWRSEMPRVLTLNLNSPAHANVRPTLNLPVGRAVRAGPNVCCAGQDSRSKLLRPFLLAHARGIPTADEITAQIA